MSNEHKRTATTALGDVEYETVTCTSCEQEILKTEAETLVAGDLKKRRDWSHMTEYNFNRVAVDGWLCDHCTTTDGFHGLNEVSLKIANNTHFMAGVGVGIFATLVCLSIFVL